MNTQFFLAFLTFFLLNACGPLPTTKDEGTLKGKVSPADSVVYVPKTKTPEELLAFSQKVQNFAPQRVSGSLSNQTVAQDVFAQHFVDAISEVDGIPREQGEKVLSDLVAPESNACGGVSCAGVFSVKQSQVPVFFDDLLDKVGSSKDLAKTTFTTLRKKIIGSFLPASARTKPAKPSDFVALIYNERPQAVPPYTKKPQEVLSKEEIQRRSGATFVQTVYEYTSSSTYHHVRSVESVPGENLLKDGMSSWHLAHWRKTSDRIFEGMKKLPVVSSNIYRGMQDLTAGDIASLYQAWKDHKPIGLGFGNKPATTSASWSIDEAMGFLRGHIFAKGGGGTYGVLLEITSHRGVSIERVSKVPFECEVLLPRDQLVLIESIAPLENSKRTFIIKMRGVEAPQVGLSLMTQGAF